MNCIQSLNQEKNMNGSFIKSLFTLSIIFVLSVFSVQMKAQKKPEIFALAGYLTNGNVTVAQGELKFKDNVSYGLGVDVPVDRNMQAEISWSMSPSQAELAQYLGTTIQLTDVYIHTFQAGALIQPNKQKVSPFGLISLGASLFSPSDSKYSDKWLFSFALGAGIKAELSDKVGIRLQARLIVPMQFAGTSVWFGTGGGGVSVGAYSSIAQGDFTGGLYIRL
jgi:opacity protein-like surface antigen